MLDFARAQGIYRPGALAFAGTLAEPARAQPALRSPARAAARGVDPRQLELFEAIAVQERR
jgi:hypothetical protein